MPNIDDNGAMVANIVLGAEVIEDAWRMHISNPELGPPPPSPGNLTRYSCRNAPVVVLSNCADTQMSGLQAKYYFTRKEAPKEHAIQKNRNIWEVVNTGEKNAEETIQHAFLI